MHRNELHERSDRIPHKAADDHPAGLELALRPILDHGPHFLDHGPHSATIRGDAGSNLPLRYEHPLSDLLSVSNMPVLRWPS